MFVQTGKWDFRALVKTSQSPGVLFEAIANLEKTRRSHPWSRGVWEGRQAKHCNDNDNYNSNNNKENYNNDDVNIILRHNI